MKLGNEIHNQYHVCGAHCSHFVPELPKLLNEAPLSPEYEALIKNIFAGYDNEVDMATASDIAAQLTEALFSGFGSTPDQVAYDTPDWNMLADLEKNVYQFSAAKNYQMLKALTLDLKDGTSIRSFAQFRRAAAQTLDTWVGNWLVAEYDTALASSQMASKLIDIQAHKEHLPLMQFKGIGDERECPICLPFNDIILPVDHPAWKYMLPPLHFKDRCTVIQLSDSYTPTPDADIPAPDNIPEGFRHNFPEEGVLFPPDHPYYEGLPKDIDKYTNKLQAKNVRNWAADKLVGKTAGQADISGITFTNQGVKEALNQPHSHPFEKNQAIYRIRQLISESRYVKTMPDAKGRIDFKWHYLQTDIAGKISYIVIREDLTTGKKIFYCIVDSIKTK